MKNIIATVVLLIMVTTFGLACKKAVESNANSDALQVNSPTAPPKASASQPATTVDKEKLLTDLVALEKEFMAATKRGDKATIERLIADDFTARYGGKLYDKDSWVGNPQGYPNIVTDEVLKPELIGSSGDAATIHFEQRTTYNDNTPPYTGMVSVTYAKKYGSWQIKSVMVGH